MDFHAMLPGKAGQTAAALEGKLTEIRLRPGANIRIAHLDGEECCGVIDRTAFEKIVSAMMGNSLYALQRELNEGYFTLPGGMRAGISGRFAAGGPRSITEISSVCVRIPSAVRGCADRIIDGISGGQNALVVSPPGMGKTTLLRDISRQLSENGKNVCIVDERDEIAAAVGGIAQLDVGPRTDIISGCGKYKGTMIALRSCAPDVIVLDELGSKEDESALAEALRCGVQVIASAHGNSLRRLRPGLQKLAEAAEFEYGILLGPGRGQIAETLRFGRCGDE